MYLADEEAPASLTGALSEETAAQPLHTPTLVNGTQPSTLLETALELIEAGCSVIPIKADGSKAPLGPWQHAQHHRAGAAQVARQLATPGFELGLAVVTGAASGNLLMVEIEGRAAHRLTELEQLAEASGLGGLWRAVSAGWMEESPSGGIHWFIRTPEPIPSRKLAQAADKGCLAETKGEGGYTIVAPSGGTVHATGKPWVLRAGGPRNAHSATLEELEQFLTVFSSLDERPADPAPDRTPRPATYSVKGITPGDDYDARTPWPDILAPHGWTRVYTAGGTTYWRRPGKSAGISATTGRADDRDRLYVFTSSTEFEPEKACTKFAAYALLNHGGDYSAAAAQLRKEGYGETLPAQRNQHEDGLHGLLLNWTPQRAQELADIEQAVTGKDPARDQPAHRELILTSAANIKPMPVFWVWEGRLALGTLGLLAGRQGLGKSTLAYWLAALITLGKLPGEFLGKPKSVLVCATEDSWEHTIVPRLIAAGADLNRVYRVEVLTADEIHVGLSLPRDNHAVEKAAKQSDAALLLLDPLISRLGGLDTHKDSDVRQALEPLVSVAGRANMAVLGLIHHNKGASGDPLQSVMGSTAFSAVARSVHTVIPDPDDETDTRRLFGTPKNNLGRTNLPTLSFTVESAPVPTEQGPAWTGYIIWGDDHVGSISEAMGRAAKGPDEDKSATQEAAAWLEDYLTMEGPEVPSMAVKAKGEKAGHSLSTLNRARKRLGVISEVSGFPRTSKWSLPQKPPVVPQ